MNDLSLPYIGVVYTHWNSDNCPLGTITAYSGNILISASETLKFSQPLCQTMEVNNTLATIGIRPIRTQLSRVTCAVCLLPAQSTVFVHHGNNVCPAGWNLVYNGVMTVLTNFMTTSPICASVASGRSALRMMSSLSFLTGSDGDELACSLCSM